MMTPSPCRVTTDTKPGPRMLVIWTVPAGAARSDDHDAVVVALHGRSIATCDVEVDCDALSAAEAPQWLSTQITNIARGVGGSRIRVGLCAERQQTALALAAAARSAEVQALMLLGGGAADGAELTGGAALPPCLFVLGPGDLDRWVFAQAACQQSPTRHRLEVLPYEGEPVPLGQTDLQAEKGRLAAQWFVRHLVDRGADRCQASRPFQAGGPARLAAPHLAQCLAPRHSECHPCL